MFRYSTIFGTDHYVTDYNVVNNNNCLQVDRVSADIVNDE